MEKDLASFPWPDLPARADLPCLKAPKQASMLSMLTRGIQTMRDARGKNSKGLSSKDCLEQQLLSEAFPICCHEPLTELQRRLEGLQYAHMLNEAAALPPQSRERLMKVAAFNVAYWASSATRTQRKAFRPLPGETFHIVDRQQKVLALAENVETSARGPYRSVCKSWGLYWSMQLESFVEVKVIDLGTAVSFDSNSGAEIVFNDGDVYHMIMPPGQISGMTGSLKFTHMGSAIVHQVRTGMSCELDLREPSLLSMGKKHQVTGHVTEKGAKDATCKLSGYWNKEIRATYVGQESQVLWTAATIDTKNEYKLGNFAVQLNHCPKCLADVLPSSDSRLRPDVRGLDDGNIVEAEQAHSNFMTCLDTSEKQDREGGHRWFVPRETPLQTCIPGRFLKYRYGNGYWENLKR